MSVVKTIPSQVLLYRTDHASGHSTRPHGNATQSAFSDYAFGPIDTHGDHNKKENKPVSGLAVNQGSAPSWISQLEMAPGSKG